MKLFPAIDMIGGKAVRLVRGDYAQMTVYSDDPVSVARSFAEAGATCMHMVDLEGARDGGCPNLDTIRRIVQDTELFVEVGGGIRDAQTVETYLSAGVGRVILGTAAVTNPAFLDDMLRQHGERIAVGVDIRDGYVAIKGWTELSEMTCFDFCADLERRGVRTVICTDISKDGLLGGTNTELYADMSHRFSMQLVASGGVSSLSDVERLTDMGLYGAILGKALYTGHIDLKEALRVARREEKA